MSKLSTWLGRGPAARIPSEAAVFRLQTSAYGLAVPLVYGTARLSGNVLHVFDEQTRASTQKQRTGKGGRGIETTTYSYTAAVMIGLCEGPIIGIGAVWRDRDALTWSQLQAAGWTRAIGTATQGVWPSLTSKRPAEAIPYVGTAYAAHAALDLPDNAIPNYSWEVQGPWQVGGGVVDASPRDVLVDVLTNTSYGAGWPAARIGDLWAFDAYTRALGLFVSPVFAEQRPTTEHLRNLLLAANSAAVWSDGVLKVVPYGDAPASGHGATFTPNTQPLYDLDDRHFLREDGGDPIEVDRGTTADAFNHVQVEYEDRASDYNTAIQEAKDQAAIERYGLRSAPVVKLPAIKTADVARLVAQLGLQRSAYVRNTYRFRLSWQFALLEPMDLITLTDATLGLDHTPVRITQIEDSDDDALVVTAEDWPLGIASATRYPAPQGDGFSPSTSTDPGATVVRVVRAPALLAASALELWLVASGGADWGGCEVWLSADGAHYDRVGTIERRGILGRLTGALGATTGDTLALALDADGVAIGPQLLSVTDAALDASLTLSAVLTDPPEFVAFRDATLLGPARYACSTLRRGLYASTAGSAPAATPVVRLDDAVFVLSLPTAKAGQTYYLKCPAFNGYGGGLQPLAAVAPVAVTITSDPQTPGGGGIPGVNGRTTERRYLRAVSQPLTPTGRTPEGWTLPMPSGTDPLWATEAIVDSGTDALLSTWSAPQRMTGDQGTPGPLTCGLTNDANTAVAGAFVRKVSGAAGTFDAAAHTRLGCPVGSGLYVEVRPLLEQSGDFFFAGLSSDPLLTNDASSVLWAWHVVTDSTGSIATQRFNFPAYGGTAIDTHGPYTSATRLGVRYSPEGWVEWVKDGVVVPGSRAAAPPSLAVFFDSAIGNAGSGFELTGWVVEAAKGAKGERGDPGPVGPSPHEVFTSVTTTTDQPNGSNATIAFSTDPADGAVEVHATVVRTYNGARVSAPEELGVVVSPFNYSATGYAPNTNGTDVVSVDIALAAMKGSIAVGVASTGYSFAVCAGGAVTC